MSTFWQNGAATDTSCEPCDLHPADIDLLPRDGRRHLGVLEQVMRRQWDPVHGNPPDEVIAAIGCPLSRGALGGLRLLCDVV
ncbi:hypothetical protein [Actinomadura keratinilytica]|uniref:Uncharacterized protein n=1 Tax=Actinomadura keratinilytica TaxID=547461 RepID=A0ABP7ZHS2_9ACTN